VTLGLDRKIRLISSHKDTIAQNKTRARRVLFVLPHGLHVSAVLPPGGAGPEVWVRRPVLTVTRGGVVEVLVVTEVEGTAAAAFQHGVADPVDGTAFAAF
jgi:hypothetical protein